jgi:enamine deaminase RidA (YjgF/YER057c/UK114 family)
VSPPPGNTESARSSAPSTEVMFQRVARSGQIPLLTDDARDQLLRRLPPPPLPQGGYVPAIAHSGLVVTAGMTPRINGVLHHCGQVGAELTVEAAREAAAIAADNALAAAVAALAPGERLNRVLRLTVYVNAAPGFTAHTEVADGASARLRELLADRGAAVRAAVGVTSLPGGSCVELELTCAYGTAQQGNGQPVACGPPRGQEETAAPARPS